MTELLLLLSNSTSPGRGFLEHGLDVIAELVPAGRRLLFVPFAAPGPTCSGCARGHGCGSGTPRR
jgi:peptidase E